VKLLKIITFLFPWFLRRRMLNKWFGYKIHAKASIGLAWIFPRELIMEAGSRIDHFNVAIHLDKIELGSKAAIGRGNWITGFPTNSNSPHFRHQPQRKAELVLGESANITKYHHFDCTSQIHIGRYATIAGYASQFLTHSIDLNENRQDSNPILIGEYSFIGTNVVVLGGSELPNYSVLAAKSLLNKTFSDEWMLYAGLPAHKIKEVPKTAKYFTRLEGFVY
jgi:acetyltransferase-like isoleucine patch superfamily enzyme